MICVALDALFVSSPLYSHLALLIQHRYAFEHVFAASPRLDPPSAGSLRQQLLLFLPDIIATPMLCRRPANGLRIVKAT